MNIIKKPLEPGYYWSLSSHDNEWYIVNVGLDNYGLYIDGGEAGDEVLDEMDDGNYIGPLKVDQYLTTSKVCCSDPGDCDCK